MKNLLLLLAFLALKISAQDILNYLNSAIL